MTETTKVYWDACAWLGLINQEVPHHNSLSNIYESARRGELEIWTSAFTYAEVFRKKCEAGLTVSLDIDRENEIKDILEQDFLKIVPVDMIIGKNARKLLRENPALKKPQDAIHLATALWWDIDVVHTFDGSNLLPLNEKVKCRNGKSLRICVPADEMAGPLFSKEKKNETKK